MRYNLHGTYGSAGQFHPQTVRPARTMSGRPGLFTAGTLAHPMDDDEFASFMALPRSAQVEYCLRRGFTLEAA